MATKSVLAFYLFYFLILVTTRESLADISVSVNPQSQQTPLNKDIVMNCEFRFTTKLGQGSPPVEETGSEIEWLKKDVSSPIFKKVVEYKASGFMPRSIDVRVYAYDSVKQTKGSSLEIRRVSDSDAGTYKCIIRGGKTGGGDETTQAQLQIVPEISVSPSVVNIELDRPFLLSCNITTNERGISALDQRTLYGSNVITWTFSNARYINPDDTIAMQRLMDMAKDISTFPSLAFDVSSNAHQLSVRRATVEHAGYYWCTYRASTGSFQGRVFENAIARYGPTFKLNEFNRTNTTRAIKAFVGETIDIYCNIISLPYGNIEWFRRNMRIGHNQIRHDTRLDGKRYYYQLIRDTTGLPTILRMNNLQYNDRDEYVCNVTAFGIRVSWSTLLKVKDKYSAFYPLGVIITQMVLIFSLIFGAEKIYVHKGSNGNHAHHHHHHHHPTHTSLSQFNLDTGRGTTTAMGGDTADNDPSGTNMFRTVPTSGGANVGMGGGVMMNNSNNSHHHSYSPNLLFPINSSTTKSPNHSQLPAPQHAPQLSLPAEMHSHQRLLSTPLHQMPYGCGDLSLNRSSTLPGGNPTRNPKNRGGVI